MTKKKRKFGEKKEKKIIRKIKRRSKTKFSKKEIKDTSSNELIFKTKPEWIKNSLANKAQYQKRYNESSRIIMHFGKKREKNFMDKTFKKIKDVKYSKEEVKLNGLKMEH